MLIRRHCPEVFDRVEVWVDGGIRRGTDVVKALCLGARGVGVGRAALFGLGAGGKEGVGRVLESKFPPSDFMELYWVMTGVLTSFSPVLKAETETCMRLLGVERVDQLGMQHINARAVERDIYDDGPVFARAEVERLARSPVPVRAKL